MNSFKLNKLEAVAEIVNRLDSDLKQATSDLKELKEWIKSQFESTTQNTEPDDGSNLRIVSYCSTSPQVDPDDLNSPKMRETRARSRNNGDFRPPPPPLIKAPGVVKEDPEDQMDDLEDGRGASEEDMEQIFILGDDFGEEEDPLGNVEVQMSTGHEAMDHVNGRVMSQVVEEVSQSQSGHRCRVCLRSFSSKSDVARHEETHLQGTSYQCDQCGGRFKTRNSWRVHKYRKHGGKALVTIKVDPAPLSNPHKIPLASASIPRATPIRALRKTGGTGFEGGCQFCGRKYWARSSLFDHLQKVHFVCGNVTCNFLQFDTKEALWAHKRKLHYTRRNTKTGYGVFGSV